MPSKHFNTTAAPLIRQMKEKDRETVLRIWDAEFGIEDMDGQAEFVDAAVDTNDSYTVGVTAFAPANDSLVGFGIACRTNPEWTADYLRVSIEPEIPDNAAVFHIGCVRSHWQGRGIGTKLFKARLQWAMKNDAPAAFGVSWLREGHYGSAALFESFGFERAKTVEGYYLHELEESSCPDCGYPCECDAAIYYRGLG